MRLAILCMCLSLAGCTATFQDGRSAVEERTEWSHYFLLGSIGHAELDARDLCPSGRLSRVRTGGNALTLGASLLTVGIYTPRRVTYVCEERAR
ncbi:MAG: hypothetical protein R3B13_23630 [Polyangiaceae bacterium]